MKKFKYSLFLYLLLTFIFAGCTSAKKAYSKGDYRAAFEKSLQKLNRNSDDAELKNILEKSLQEIIRETEILAQKGLSKEVSISLYEKIQRDISRSIEMISKAESIVKNKFESEKVSLQNHHAIYQDRLARYYYNEGIILYGKGAVARTKRTYQQAYSTFKKAEKYGLDIPNLAQLIDSSLIKGTYHIRVNAEATFELMYEWDIDRKFENITACTNRFQKVYFEKSPKKLDCIITIDLRSLDLDDSEDSRKEYFDKKIQDGYNTETDTAGNTIETPKYIEIEGTVEIITAKRTAEWSVDVSVRNLSKQSNFIGTQFTEREVATVELYELSGDKRAIPDQYDVSFPEELPSEDDLVEILIEKIYERFRQEYF